MTPETETKHSKPAKWVHQSRWREKNPKKVWAQRSLRSAMKQGLINPEPCTVCGDLQADAHHDDYDKPLAVRWLCRKHHKARHRELRGRS